MQIAHCVIPKYADIGVYSREENAEKAIERLSKQSGFRDSRESFSVDEYVIDEDNWTEGFVTETYEPVWSSGGEMTMEMCFW